MALSYVQVLKDWQLLSIYPTAILVGDAEFLLNRIHELVIRSEWIEGKAVRAVTREGMIPINDFTELRISWIQVRNIIMPDDSAYRCCYRNTYPEFDV